MGVLVFVIAVVALLVAVWVARLRAALLAWRQAQAIQAAAEQGGDPDRRVIAAQRAADRRMTVARLTRFVPWGPRR
jgi:hypothetical protein